MTKSITIPSELKKINIKIICSKSWEIKEGFKTLPTKKLVFRAIKIGFS